MEKNKHFYYTVGYSFPLGAHCELSFWSLPHSQVICCTGHSRWNLCPTEQHCLVERDACESLQLCISNHTPTPLRTRESLHSIQQCKGVQRPSAIFRCEGSKSITGGRYWDSWISTRSGTGMIMHLYLSTSSSLCPYHHQIHFPDRQYCIFP